MCVSNKNMSQIKSLLRVKPNKRLAHSSAICCLYSSLPPVFDETTACAPTFRSASPGKAPLANKQLPQKSCYVLHTRFHTSTGQNLCRLQGVLCCSCLYKSGCPMLLVYCASCFSYLCVYGHIPCVIPLPHPRIRQDNRQIMAVSNSCEKMQARS